MIKSSLVMLYSSSKIVRFIKRLKHKNLFLLKTGTISIRTKKNGINGFLITPLSIKDSKIVFVSKSAFLNKKKYPQASNHWKLHNLIYNSKKDVHAIIHCYSICATAISSFRKSVPAFNYMVASAGGNDIKCSKYSVFGSKKFYKYVMEALKNRTACLISNHGQVALGNKIEDAFTLAEKVENLCDQYINSLRVGIPKILSKKEIGIVLKEMKKRA